MSYSVPGQEVIRQSAALRGQGQFQEAIDFVQANMASLDETIVANGWIECFKAAKEMGDREQATLFAREIARELPDFPSIQGYV